MINKKRDDKPKTGRIMAHHGLRVHIDTGDGGIVEFKPPRREDWVVGDVVHFVGDRPKTIEPRRNELLRVGSNGTPQTLAANLDLLIIVTACGDAFKPGLIDRFIVAAGHAGITPAIVLNKIDLPGAEDNIKSVGAYEKLGYDVHCVSAMTGVGMVELANFLHGSTSALAGHSGVGKTSLTNALLPGLNRAIGEIHEATGQGRHKTTTALMTPLPNGGFIIDSPGMRQFTPSGLTQQDAATYFPGFADIKGKCRFRDCLHKTEPLCKVREAVETGELSKDLYDSYLRLIQSILEHTEPEW